MLLPFKIDNLAMKYKFKRFTLYAKEFGWGNAIIFALFKQFPRFFILLHHKVNGGNNHIWPEMANQDPVMMLGTVLDYKPWAEYGGHGGSRSQ
ncbi:hypothetical protein ABK905_00270 [Acerihabitans sp. KWT182]|uniref:Uncharacterized protein n=1 Tax=Acerihabitans sp. KWT182 TaxID=3157919 RepID=A0AAU7Q9W5_9GAMM